ncbi:MAG: hypothetical protein JHC77_06910, partial [Opitutales bacterium]|nr:hypothetical protein [Opitutales bacterium]
MTPSLSPSVPPSSKLFKAMPLRCLITAGPTREFFDPVRFV